MREFLNIPNDSIAQIRARNIITDRTSLEYYKQVKKDYPIMRSTSNSLLKNIWSEK